MSICVDGTCRCEMQSNELKKEDPLIGKMGGENQKGYLDIEWRRFYHEKKIKNKAIVMSMAGFSIIVVVVTMIG